MLVRGRLLQTSRLDYNGRKRHYLYQPVMKALELPQNITEDMQLEGWIQLPGVTGDPDSRITSNSWPGPLNGDEGGYCVPNTQMRAYVCGNTFSGCAAAKSPKACQAKCEETEGCKSISIHKTYRGGGCVMYDFYCTATRSAAPQGWSTYVAPAPRRANYTHDPDGATSLSECIRQCEMHEPLCVDSDSCLQSKPDWDAASTCSGNVQHCTGAYRPDMSKCCPLTCDSCPAKCNTFSWSLFEPRCAHFSSSSNVHKDPNSVLFHTVPVPTQRARVTLAAGAGAMTVSVDGRKRMGSYPLAAGFKFVPTFFGSNLEINQFSVTHSGRCHQFVELQVLEMVAPNVSESNIPPTGSPTPACIDDDECIRTAWRRAHYTCYALRGYCAYAKMKSCCPNQCNSCQTNAPTAPPTFAPTSIPTSHLASVALPVGSHSMQAIMELAKLTALEVQTVTVPYGCSVTVYDSPNFGGVGKTLSAGVTELAIHPDQKISFIVGEAAGLDVDLNLNLQPPEPVTQSSSWNVAASLDDTAGKISIAAQGTTCIATEQNFQCKRPSDPTWHSLSAGLAPVTSGVVSDSGIYGLEADATGTDLVRRVCSSCH